MKIHGNESYFTTKGHKNLKPCSMKFKIMFWTRSQRKQIKRFLLSLYCVGLCAGIPEPELEFLQHPERVIYLTTIYNGSGIKTHIDKNFYGAVFCYVTYLKMERGDINDLDANKLMGKCICWGGKGTKVMIEGSWIQNHQNQLYWFYGVMTDYGVHCVPLIKGWRCILHIFRAKRTKAICDS